MRSTHTLKRIQINWHLSELCDSIWTPRIKLLFISNLRGQGKFRWLGNTTPNPLPFRQSAHIPPHSGASFPPCRASFPPTCHFQVSFSRAAWLRLLFFQHLAQFPNIITSELISIPVLLMDGIPIWVTTPSGPAFLLESGKQRLWPAARYLQDSNTNSTD